jgi:hypothetical protein
MRRDRVPAGSVDLPPIEYYPQQSQREPGTKTYYVVNDDGHFRRVFTEPYDICVED